MSQLSAVSHQPSTKDGNARAFLMAPLKAGQLTVEPAVGGRVRSQPVEITALSGEVIDHWWWGRLAFDMSGMFRRSTPSPIDWGHDSEITLGHFGAHRVEGSQLILDGVLLARTDDPEHRSHEVIDLMAAGQPYQASIDFSARMDGDWESAYVMENQSVTANGRVYTGPLTLFTKWPLNAVAIYPHGYDPYTSAGPAPAQLSAKLPQGHPMTKTELTPPDAPATPPPAAPATPPPAQLAAPATAPPAAPSTPPPAAPATQLTPDTLKKWSDLLGPEQAIASLSAGETLETALGHRITTLTKANADQLTAHSAALLAKDAEISALKAKLAAARPGIDTPTGSALDASSSGDRASMLTPVDKTAAAIEAAMAKAK